MKIDSPQLDYAPVPPLYRRKRFRRMVVLLLLLAAVYPAWRWGLRAWNRGKLLYAQHRCLAYTAPSDLIVYESEGLAARELLKKAEYAPLPVYGSGGWSINLGKVAAYTPAELADFERIAGPSTSGPCALLFMHGLRDKNGRERLVIVRRDSQSFGPITHPFNLITIVFSPATFSSDLAITPQTKVRMWSYSGPVNSLPSTGLRYYAGQIDPIDAAHFSIRYELEGQEGLIDGRLNDEGDDVDYVIKTGPAAPPSPWSNVLTPTTRISVPPGR